MRCSTYKRFGRFTTAFWNVLRFEQNARYLKNLILSPQKLPKVAKRHKKMLKTLNNIFLWRFVTFFQHLLQNIKTQEFQAFCHGFETF
jgi:hypothetical protein